MFATTLRVPILKKLCRPMLALGLACAVGGFTAGCVDNSGNKNYPRGDAAVADTAVEAPDDTGTTQDAPETDAPATDTPTSDVPSVDGLTDTGGTDARADAVSTDVLADTGTGG